MSRHDCDSVVVGGGCAGIAAALALAEAGLTVTLVEPDQPPAAPDPEDYDLRVYALSPASQMLLQALQVWPVVQQRRVSPYVRMEVWDVAPDLGLAFDAADTGVPELGHIVEEGVVRWALWQRLASHVNVVQAAVSGYCADTGSVVLTLEGARTLRARLVVAADGAGSPLRGFAGISVTAWDYPQSAVVAHVHTERPHGGTAFQRFLDSGPLALLPLADGRSSIVWSTTPEAARRYCEIDDASFLAALNAAMPQRLGAFTASTPRRAFPLRFLQAQQYMGQRLALLGDAAHVVHPLAGQGLNLGLGDVTELREAVAWALARGADPGGARVLARYQRARKASALEMAAVTDGLFRLYQARLPLLKPLRAAGLALFDQLPGMRAWLAQQAMR